MLINAHCHWLTTLTTVLWWQISIHKLINYSFFPIEHEILPNVRFDMDSSSLYYKLLHLPVVQDVNTYQLYRSAKSKWIIHLIYFKLITQSFLLDNKSFIQRLGLLRKLPVHNGCVCCYNLYILDKTSYQTENNHNKILKIIIKKHWKES